MLGWAYGRCVFGWEGKFPVKFGGLAELQAVSVTASNIIVFLVIGTTSCKRQERIVNQELGRDNSMRLKTLES